MKHLSKMAYELRDVTIFYDKYVNVFSTKEIAVQHNRSTSRINQILKIQMDRYKHFLIRYNQETVQCEAFYQQKLYIRLFYHYEIRLILQRYYIRMKNEN